MQKSGHMFLKGVNWVHNDKLGQMVLKGVILGTQLEIWSNGFEKKSDGYTMQKSHHMVLKGVNRVHNDKIRSKGLERTNLGRQYKNQVIWS